MWRYLLALLISLPPLALVLNHDVISTVLMIGWTCIIIPLCLLQAVNFLRSNPSQQRTLLKNILRIPVALLGLTAIASGLSIILWVLYNLITSRSPLYTGPDNLSDLLLNGFGIATVLIGFGWAMLKICRFSFL